MTLEIYDYLLIRSFFAKATIDYNLEDLDEEFAREDFYNTLVSINALMDKEAYFIVIPDALIDVEKILERYRFKYMKDKDITNEINQIIIKINTYKKILEKDKKKMAKVWYDEEIKDRVLPRKYQREDYIIGFLVYDYVFAKTILRPFDSEIFNEQVTFDTYQGQKNINNVIPFLSVINLMFSRFPQFIEKYVDIDAIISRLHAITQMENITLEELKYMKATIKNIHKVTKKMNLEERNKILFIKENENSTKKIEYLNI